MLEIMTPEQSYERYREIFETIKVGEFLDFRSVIFEKGKWPTSVHYLFEVEEVVSPNSFILRNVLDGGKTIYTLKERGDEIPCVNKHIYTKGRPTDW